MDAVAFTLRAVALARGFGLTVTFEPGWDTRGNGYAANYVGVSEHHTGTPSSATNPFPTRRLLRDGRTGLSGPLCNSAGPADASIHIVAAHPANHAGSSGGRSMGPLPVTKLFNPRMWGHEIDYAGSAPMLVGQYVAATIWAHCLLRALVEFRQIPVFDPQRVRAHAETSVTGKWDPGYAPEKTIDMAAFRAAVANPEVNMPLTGSDFNGFWMFPCTGTGPDGKAQTWPAITWITVMAFRIAAIEKYTAELVGRDPIDVDEAKVAANLAPMLVDALAGQLSELDESDYARIATAVADENARRQAA